MRRWNHMCLLPFRRSSGWGLPKPEDWVAIYDERDLTVEAAAEYIHQTEMDHTDHVTPMLALLPRHTWETVFRSVFLEGEEIKQ